MTDTSSHEVFSVDAIGPSVSFATALFSVSLFSCCNSFSSIHKLVSASSSVSVTESMAEMSTSLSYAEVELIFGRSGDSLVEVINTDGSCS